MAGSVLKKTSTPRFLWADIVRILAIFLVISTHLGYHPDYVTLGGIIYFLHFAIVKTCIPLFVMLSGALLLGRSEPYGMFFSKRFGRLMLPWIFWSGVYLLLDKKYLPLISDIPSFFRTFLWVMESFWFLPMIVCLYILTPALQAFIKKASHKEIAYIVVIWFLAVSVLPYHHNSMAFPRQVDDGLLRQTINFLGYYFLGYLIVVLRGKLTSMFSLLIFLLGLSWTTIMLLLNPLPAQEAMYLFDYVSPGNILMSLGIFAFIVSLLGNMQVPDNMTGKSIKAVASATLGIYLVHALFLPFIHKNIHIATNLFLNRILSAFILFGMCFVVIYLLKKIPYLRRFVS